MFGIISPGTAKSCLIFYPSVLDLFNPKLCRYKRRRCEAAQIPGSNFADSLETIDLGLRIQNTGNVVISEKLIPNSLMSASLRILFLILILLVLRVENLKAKLPIWLKLPPKVAVNFNC